MTGRRTLVSVIPSGLIVVLAIAAMASIPPTGGAPAGGPRASDVAQPPQILSIVPDVALNAFSAGDARDGLLVEILSLETLLGNKLDVLDLVDDWGARESIDLDDLLSLLDPDERVSLLDAREYVDTAVLLGAVRHHSVRRVVERLRSGRGDGGLSPTVEDWLARHGNILDLLSSLDRNGPTRISLASHGERPTDSDLLIIREQLDARTAGGVSEADSRVLFRLAILARWGDEESLARLSRGLAAATLQELVALSDEGAERGPLLSVFRLSRGPALALSVLRTDQIELLIRGVRESDPGTHRDVLMATCLIAAGSPSREASPSLMSLCMRHLEAPTLVRVPAALAVMSQGFVADAGSTRDAAVALVNEHVRTSGEIELLTSLLPRCRAIFYLIAVLERERAADGAGDAAWRTMTLEILGRWLEEEFMSSPTAAVFRRRPDADRLRRHLQKLDRADAALDVRIALTAGLLYATSIGTEGAPRHKDAVLELYEDTDLAEAKYDDIWLFRSIPRLLLPFELADDGVSHVARRFQDRNLMVMRFEPLLVALIAHGARHGHHEVRALQLSYERFALSHPSPPQRAWSASLAIRSSAGRDEVVRTTTLLARRGDVEALAAALRAARDVAIVRNDYSAADLVACLRVLFSACEPTTPMAPLFESVEDFAGVGDDAFRDAVATGLAQLSEQVHWRGKLASVAAKFRTPGGEEQ